MSDPLRQGVPRLPLLTLEDLDHDQRTLYDAIVAGPRQLRHGVPLEGPFNSMLHHPPVGDALQRLGAVLRFRGRLGDRSRELATLVVAAWFECEFEWYSHSAAARAVGVDDQQIEALRTGRTPPGLSGVEVLVIEVARALLDRGDLAEGEYDDAVRTLGPEVLVELSTLVGYYSLLALQLRLFRVGLPEGVPDAFAPDALGVTTPERSSSATSSSE